MIAVFFLGQVHFVQLHLALLFCRRCGLPLTLSLGNPDLPGPHRQQGLVGFLFSREGGDQGGGLFFDGCQFCFGLFHSLLGCFPSSGHAGIAGAFGGGFGDLLQGVRLGIFYDPDIGRRWSGGAVQLPCGVDDLFLQFG